MDRGERARRFANEVTITIFDAESGLILDISRVKWLSEFKNHRAFLSVLRTLYSRKYECSFAKIPPSAFTQLEVRNFLIALEPSLFIKTLYEEFGVDLEILEPIVMQRKIVEAQDFIKSATKSFNQISEMTRMFNLADSVPCGSVQVYFDSALSDEDQMDMSHLINDVQPIPEIKSGDLDYSDIVDENSHESLSKVYDGIKVEEVVYAGPGAGKSTANYNHTYFDTDYLGIDMTKTYTQRKWMTNIPRVLCYGEKKFAIIPTREVFYARCTAEKVIVDDMAYLEALKIAIGCRAKLFITNNYVSELILSLMRVRPPRKKSVAKRCTRLGE